MDNQNKKPSIRYQDYVIHNGRFIGDFEGMYRNSTEVPWHQDKTVHAVFSDLTVTLLRRLNPLSLLDVGCGLGYMTARMLQEIPTLHRVVGLEVSASAVHKARAMFPDIHFHVGTLPIFNTHTHTPQLHDETFDVCVSKDVLWYVLDDLDGYFKALKKSSRHWVYIGQSFPESRPFFGDDVLPNADALLACIVAQGYHISYSLIERDSEYGNREYVHVLIDVTV